VIIVNTVKIPFFVFSETNILGALITAVTMLATTTQTDIDQCIQKIAETASEYPGVVIIHNLQTATIAWMSDRGLKQLGASLEDIAGMSAAEYHDRYFNPEDAKDYVPKIYEFLQRNNDDEILTHFQQVRFHDKADWVWHLTSTRILFRNDDGTPLLILSIAFPVDAMHHITQKAARLLDENNFLRRNYNNYSKLSQREREVLRLLAMGKSAAETADELYIAINTVETHRKNLKQKLGTGSFYELSQYARAFNLI
jgi:DNA-binding CsgD family transcriptional regulator